MLRAERQRMRQKALRSNCPATSVGCGAQLAAHLHLLLKRGTMWRTRMKRLEWRLWLAWQPRGEMSNLKALILTGLNPYR